MKKRKTTSAKKSRRRRGKPRPDYVLQGTDFDLSMETVLGFSSKQRRQYINAVLDALPKAIRADKFSLKPNVPFKKEMRDLRRILYGAADQYLFIDEKTNKRNVLSTGSPGSTHTYWPTVGEIRNPTNITSLSFIAFTRSIISKSLSHFSSSERRIGRDMAK